MRILKDFEIPKLKFPKLKMDNLDNIEELKVDLSNIEKKAKKNKTGFIYEPYRYQTIKEAFDDSTKKFANKEFILERFEKKGEFEKITYKKFREDVISLGTGLEKILTLKDKRVIIVGENTYYWYVSYMMLLCSDAVAVPVDKELPENEFINLVKRAGTDVIIYSKKKKELIEKVKKDLDTVQLFVEMNSDEKIIKNEKRVGIESVIKLGNEWVTGGDNSFMNIEINPEEFKVLIFTSGTTAAAKGVMLCNRNLAENINAVSAYVKINPSDRLFSILPLHHTYESTIGFLVPMTSGCSIAICEGLRHIVPNLKETKPTIILVVPLLIESIYKKINDNIKKSKKENMVNSMIHITNALSSVNIDIKKKVFKEIHENLGGNLRLIVSAAAPIDEKIGQWLNDIGILFLQGYGLTETAPIAALVPEFNPVVGSVGKPIICANIKINNPNENGEGEILISSSTLMLGYYENEEATNEVIKNRWFYSGDVGYIDKNGYIYITGRSKNVIVTQNGKNIYPEEIELLLGNISEIKECMVYGREDKKENDLIITARVIPNIEYINKNHKKNATEDEIYKIIWSKIKEINKELTSYKAIKRLEIKRDEFIKTTTLKIKRNEELNKVEDVYSKS